jgi:hypothetical protein
MLKTTSGSSNRIDLSNNIAFSQSQSHSTVFLKTQRYCGLSFLLTYLSWEYFTRALGLMYSTYCSTGEAKIHWTVHCGKNHRKLIRPSENSVIYN